MTVKPARVEDIDHGWADIQKNVKKLGKAHTKVGYFGGGTDPSKDIAARAAVMEYGARIRVTPKMKGYFLFNFGVALKKKIIEIPKRPFFRTAFEKNYKQLGNIAAKEYNDVLEGKSNARQSLSRMGEWMVGRVKHSITNGSWAANSSLTVKLKGSSKPLIDSGELRNSVTHREFLK